MKTEWQSLKSLQGCLLTGIYASQLHVRDDLVLFSSEYVFKIKNPVTLEFWYWKISWFEDEDLTDYLILNEQETPEPLDYLEDPELSPNQHIIIGSLFYFEDNLINKVSGYGYKDEHIEILTTLVFEFEESYLFVKTGPLIEARITKDRPNNLGDFIFSL